MAVPAYSFLGKGTLAYDSGGSAIQAGMPAGWLPGHLLILWTGASLTSETLATPDGWTLLSADSGATNVKFYGRIAVAGDIAPIVNWSGTTASWAQIAAFYGSVHVDLTTIVNASHDGNGTANNIAAPSITPTVDNCLILVGTKKSKTATSDGGVLSAISGLTQIDQNYPAGTGTGDYWGYVQQTTAAAFAQVNQTQSGGAESTKYQASSIALVAGPSTVPTIGDLNPQPFNVGNWPQMQSNSRGKPRFRMG